MQILDFITLVDLNSKNETERAKLLCFYYTKETGATQFRMVDISTLMMQCGYCAPNTSRLKINLLKGKDKAMIAKGSSGVLEFIPAIAQKLDKEIGTAWGDTETIVSNSELIEEAKFCGKKPFTDRLIKQINFTYGNNCYDACAVLMRRLFEVLLVLSYQNLGIEADITNPQGYHFMLEGIVKNAVQNKKLNVPARISKNFDSFREVGNNSAHSITYTAGKKDIDDIKISYRVMMEDLFNRAGIM